MDAHDIARLDWPTSYTAYEVSIGPHLIGFVRIVRRGSKDKEHCVWIRVATPHGLIIEPEITIELHV